MFNIGDKVVANNVELFDINYLKCFGIHQLELLKEEILIVCSLHSSTYPGVGLLDIRFNEKRYIYKSNDFISLKEHRKQKLNKIEYAKSR